MPTLSLCVICKNEENNIGKLLDSVRGDLFDEIVLTDTGSTDRTIEIASSYPKVKIEHFPWINDFSAARNYCFSKATSTQIMWLDSDDIIKPVDYQKLLAIKPRLDESDMWLFKYEYAHDDQGNSICSFFRERIVRRSLNVQWQDPIHEYMPLTGSIKKEEIEIHHNKVHNSSTRNITILEEAHLKDPNNARIAYYLGKELKDVGETERAFNIFSKFVTMPGAWSENVYPAYLVMSDYMQHIGNKEKSKEYIFEAIKILPYKADAYCKMGDQHMSNSDWKGAIHWYTIASNMQRPEEILDIVEPKYFTWLPHLQMCVCYNNLGKVMEASKHNDRVLDYNPQDSRALHNKTVFNGYIKRVNPETTYRKIGWMVPNSIDAGTIRIRTLNINDQMSKQGIQSSLCDESTAFSYDIVVVGKLYSSEQLSLIKRLKASGIYVICDLSEDIVGWHGVNEILQECNLVVCCSHKLMSRVMPINPSVIVIEDSLEHIV